MLLVVDIGNSSVVLGGFPQRSAAEGEDGYGIRGKAAALPAVHRRLPMLRSWGRDSYLTRLEQFWDESEAGADGFHDAALCSVVAPMTRLWRGLLRDMLGREPLVLHQRMELGVTLDVERPQTVGMDRLADAAALRKRVTGAAVCVDFGTATTFNVVDEKGCFRGGAIAPGLGTAAAGLKLKAPSLPDFEMEPPTDAIGRSTQEALRAGVVLGHTALVEGVLSRIEDQLNAPLRVIATGGLGHVIAPLTSSIDCYDPWLTLAGVREIYALNCKPGVSGRVQE